ncbi:hypothetical protein M9435_004852 [Picochlorum sp. BPE23]|nr:hypothetical protein M9435_004852 [Picochlorum sp. BPE23]
MDGYDNPSVAREQEAKVGVGVLVCKTLDSEAIHVLVSKRKGKVGRNAWALPGGKLEFGESFERTAARELEEETGIAVPESDFRFEYAVNTVFDASTHYVTVFMSCTVCPETRAQTREPDKHSDWEFVDWNMLRQQTNESYLPLFEPLKTLCDNQSFTLETTE